MRLYIYEANNMPIFLFITIFNLWITNSVKAVGITLFKFFQQFTLQSNIFRQFLHTKRTGNLFPILRKIAMKFISDFPEVELYFHNKLQHKVGL